MSWLFRSSFHVIAMTVVLAFVCSPVLPQQPTGQSVPNSTPETISVNADPETVARTMVSSLNVLAYPDTRTPGYEAKYGFSEVATTYLGDVQGRTAFEATLRMPDVAARVLISADLKDPFESEWFKETRRLGFNEHYTGLYLKVATAAMKGIRYRQDDYLARARALTPHLVDEWVYATKRFNADYPEIVVLLMIQHDKLFAKAAVPDRANKNELKRLNSIPFESAAQWRKTVGPRFRLLDAAFSLLAAEGLFSGSTFNKTLFDRVRPLAERMLRTEP